MEGLEKSEFNAEKETEKTEDCGMSEKKKKSRIRIFLSVTAMILAAMIIMAMPVTAWLAVNKVIAIYTPVSKPESLFIGAGHRNIDTSTHSFTDDHFEDIRYLYFNGIDVNAGEEYYDYVFCIFGKMISGYKIQLAFTTNNQFRYEIFRASESTTDSPGAVEYRTHSASPQTYYYTATGTALAGSFLNARVVNGETIADSSRHVDTYGSYDDVQKYGEPLYWQTANSEPGYGRGDFINYYILRVYINGKIANDRETDVICISAKSFSVTS